MGNIIKKENVKIIEEPFVIKPIKEKEVELEIKKALAIQRKEEAIKQFLAVKREAEEKEKALAIKREAEEKEKALAIKRQAEIIKQFLSIEREEKEEISSYNSYNPSSQSYNSPPSGQRCDVCSLKITPLCTDIQTRYSNTYYGDTCLNKKYVSTEVGNFIVCSINMQHQFASGVYGTPGWYPGRGY